MLNLYPFPPRLKKKQAYAALLAELCGTRARLSARTNAVGEIPLPIRRKVNAITKQMVDLELALRVVNGLAEWAERGNYA